MNGILRVLLQSTFLFSKKNNSDGFSCLQEQNDRLAIASQIGLNKRQYICSMYCLTTLISLINVEVGINVEGVQKLPNH